MLDAGVRTVVPNGVGELGRLDRAVVEAIAYADVFGWPLTGDEIHRYLPVVASVDEVRRRSRRVASTRWCPRSRVSTSCAGASVSWRSAAAPAAVSARLWPRALRYGRWIARLPWVRLVAVSGSLAVGAPTADADVDLFVVSAEGRLWLTRALTIGVVKLASRSAPARRVVLCPNYVVTTGALELTERDLFTAHELAQLVPLAGPETYRAVLDENQWYRQYLPNHPGFVRPIAELGEDGCARSSRPRSATRWSVASNDGRCGGRSRVSWPSSRWTRCASTTRCARGTSRGTVVARWTATPCGVRALGGVRA